MAKRNVALIAVAVIGLLVVAGAAMAQGFWKNKENQQMRMQGMGTMNGNMMEGMMGGMMQHHKGMDKVFEGTFADLVKYREEQGLKIMPWVQNEEDFRLAKQMYEKMGRYTEENGGMQGCPMMQGMMT